MTPARRARLLSILDRRQPDLTVLVEGLSKPHNVAAVIRTCDAVGVFEIHAVSTAPGFRAGQMPAAGSGRFVPVRTHPSLATAAGHLRDRGFRLLAAHLAPEAVDFRRIDYTRPVALLLGTEKDGLSAAAEGLVDGFISIPMMGAVESLNVSVAAAVILYEAQRQRAAAGMYEVPKLSQAIRQKLLFEWGYRRLAEFCRRKGVPYPRVGPGGEILDPLTRG